MASGGIFAFCIFRFTLPGAFIGWRDSAIVSLNHEMKGGRTMRFPWGFSPVPKRSVPPLLHDAAVEIVELIVGGKLIDSVEGAHQRHPIPDP
jgi:hypothetical protein